MQEGTREESSSGICWLAVFARSIRQPSRKLVQSLLFFRIGLIGINVIICST